MKIRQRTLLILTVLLAIPITIGWILGSLASVFNIPQEIGLIIMGVALVPMAIIAIISVVNIANMNRGIAK